LESDDHSDHEANSILLVYHRLVFALLVETKAGRKCETVVTARRSEEEDYLNTSKDDFQAIYCLLNLKCRHGRIEAGTDGTLFADFIINDQDKAAGNTMRSQFSGFTSSMPLAMCFSRLVFQSSLALQSPT
jgi:hypothetical protein